MPHVELFAYIAGAGAAIAVVWRLIIRPFSRAIGLVHRFFEDWFGEAPRPGLPEGRKGVLQRLDELEASSKRAEWHLGNGDKERMRDVVNRIAQEQTRLASDITSESDG